MSEPLITRKIGSFDVEPDGVLSLHGQREFPVYSAEGVLTDSLIRYRLTEEKILATIISK